MLAKYVGTSALALGLWTACSAPALAQFSPYYYNPYAAAQAQYYYNLQRMQIANTYAASVYGQATLYNPLQNQAYPATSPSTSYGQVPPYDPYNYQPYYYDPYGGFLRGTADVMRAYNSYVTTVEQARILREQAEQARLDTRKKTFELNMYIRNNTPSWTENQAKIAKDILKRVQTTTNPYEIWNGASLNVLLDDLKKHKGKNVSVVPAELGAEVLRHLNVTKSFGNLGLFRDDGKFQWPGALEDIVGEKRGKIDGLAQTLVKAARKGQIQNGVLKDLRDEIDSARTALVKKVNETPTQQYIDSKRFLKDLDDACLAVERGDTLPFFQFQDFVAKARTIKEVADYMIDKGLRFAPAVQGGEDTYSAVHTTLVALDVEVNTQVAAGAPLKQ